MEISRGQLLPDFWSNTVTYDNELKIVHSPPDKPTEMVNTDTRRVPVLSREKGRDRIIRKGNRRD